MGVYIKDMTLEEFSDYGDYCQTLIGTGQAEEVPPHGRLIDADALEMELRAENARRSWHDSFAVIFNGDPYCEAIYDCTEQFKELVNNAPTIIPAEEGET